jgi:hypothetical protein
MSGNRLGEHGVAVAAHLAGSATIHIVIIRYNNLEEHGIAVAGLLASSESIHAVDMSNNDLGEHGVAVAELFVESHSLQSLSFIENNAINLDNQIAVRNIIDDHNRLVKTLEVLNDISDHLHSGQDAQYGSMSTLIRLVAESTYDDFDNIIELS